MKRHIGKIKKSNRRCIVINPMIPGKEEYALVVDTDALFERFRDTLENIIDSPEGQNIKVLGDLLSRRRYQETGMDILKTLHEAGRLQVVKNDDIVMYPAPNHPYLLKDILENDPEYIEKMSKNKELKKNFDRELVDDDRQYIIEKHKKIEEPALSAPVITKEEECGYFVESFETINKKPETTKETAKRLFFEAEMLEIDAKRKKLEAYKLDSSLMYQTTENTKGNIDREIPNTVKKEINMEELKNKTKENLKGILQVLYRLLIYLLLRMKLKK